MIITIGMPFDYVPDCIRIDLYGKVDKILNH